MVYDLQHVSITPTTVTLFSRFMDTETGSFLKGKKDNKLPDSNDTKGMVSKKSYSRIYNRIFTYIYNVDKEILLTGKGREKIGFLTLTLPSSQLKEEKFYGKGRFSYGVWYHSDQEIKKQCLNQLFVELNKVYGLKEKLWKAEKQSNGSIHFHVLVDRFIPYSDLCTRWNRICNKLGYVDRYREKMCKISEEDYIKMRLEGVQNFKSAAAKKKYIRKLRMTYQEQKKANWMNPNSVDIHSLYKQKNGKSISNMVAYIAKYMSKEGEGLDVGTDIDRVKGRIWYCSRLISRACKVVVECTDELITAYNKALEKIKDVFVIKDEYFTCACFSIVQAVKKGILSFDRIFENNLIIERGLIYGSG